MEFPINWHIGSSLLRRPTFQRTAPGSFYNPVKYRTQVNILATFCLKCIYLSILYLVTIDVKMLFWKKLKVMKSIFRREFENDDKNSGSLAFPWA